MKKIVTPISEDVINDLKVGDKISLSGKMYCGIVRTVAFRQCLMSTAI